MKRTALRKKGKAPISKLQRELWDLCKQITRKKHGNRCYTCGAKGLIGSNCQTGHVPWPKSVLGAYLKYDLRLLKIQCYNCNINRGGMGAEAYKKMLSEIGPKEMVKLERDRQKIVKAYDWYLKLIEEYKKLLE